MRSTWDSRRTIPRQQSNATAPHSRVNWARPEASTGASHGKLRREPVPSPGRSSPFARSIPTSSILWIRPLQSQLVGDGLVTGTPGLLVGIQTADCLPLILVDPKRRAVGVFHAGWRGTVKRIAEKGVGEMRPPVWQPARRS